jgi:hypothetical protein
MKTKLQYYITLVCIVIGLTGLISLIHIQGVRKGEINILNMVITAGHGKFMVMPDGKKKFIWNLPCKKVDPTREQTVSFRGTPNE